MKRFYQLPQVALVGQLGAGRSELLSAIAPKRRHGVSFSPRLVGQLGRVSLGDPRLDRLSAALSSKKTTPIEMEFIDCEAGMGGQERQAEWFASLATADVIAAVLGLFGDDDPVQAFSVALSAICDELALWDLGVVERRLERLAADSLRIARTERERAQRQVDLFERLAIHLGGGRWVGEMALKDEELVVLRGFNLLTTRPLVVIANTADTAIGSWPELAGSCPHPLVGVAAQLEAEAGDLEESERAELLSEYGIYDPIGQRVAGAIETALRLKIAYTGNRSETRALALGPTATALDFAGAIHSDVEQGFIRAEVLTVAELLDCGSLTAARGQGKLRRAGRSYQLADGEYVSVLFSS